MNTSFSLWDPIDRGALFSDDGTHRFNLWRIWNHKRPILTWICLNPSKAGAETEDPTSEKIKRYCLRFSAGGFYLVNLFSYIATEPQALYDHDRTDLIRGKTNLLILDAIMKTRDSGGMVIGGWGTHGSLYDRDQTVMRLLKKCGTDLHALETNMGGSPKHPLYIKGDAKPVLIQKGDDRR